MIPTAEELLGKITPAIIEGMEVYGKEVVLSLMKLNAKLHAEAALKAANENAFITHKETESGNGIYIINKESILNAYPLDQIK